MNEKSASILNIIFLVIVCIIALSPYIIMVISCFSTNASIKGNSIITDLSITNFMNNWHTLLNEKYFFSSLMNSLFVSLMSSFIGVFIASMAGYAYTIFRNKGSDVLFLISFFSMLIPTAALVVPIFLIFNYLNLIDTYLAVILTSMSLPFLIFLFKQNTRLIPIELIKAARMDGIGEFGIFLKIYVPILKPVYVAAIMISFFGAWNAILLPVVLLQTQSKFTNAIFLNSMGSLWYGDYAVLMLALLLSTLPTLIIFLIFQRYLKDSLTGIN
ncbi:MAG: carbohydrate ABC transporter permease [Acholeplasmataceae bacterium]|nr:carbohydrate ABC transporter permease [Acholeplasmataceae bacterium]